MQSEACLTWFFLSWWHLYGGPLQCVTPFCCGYSQQACQGFLQNVFVLEEQLRAEHSALHASHAQLREHTALLHATAADAPRQLATLRQHALILTEVRDLARAEADVARSAARFSRQQEQREAAAAQQAEGNAEAAWQRQHSQASPLQPAGAASPQRRSPTAGDRRSNLRPV